MGEKTLVTIYTDGACSGNPGPGGYGTILIAGRNRKELSAGFRRTTNNRMELMAVIVGLQALKRSCQVELYSDSKYVVDAISKGWAQRWQANHWKRNKKDKALNIDLWKQLLPLLEKHEVSLHWVKGHASDAENNRADRLAVEASRKPNLPADKGFEEGEPAAAPTLF
ncbi:MAG: ribonuclease HI [Anaerolineae bacterium]|jgi:ribonuclease HI|nr:ribonuclease HI [Anaerolineae bacterium]